MELESLALENEWIRLLCYPSIGGKIASIFSKPVSQELLWQSQETYRSPFYGASFSEFDKSGIDECFPMIDAETLEWNGKTYLLPDHGELWCQGWEMTKDSNSIFGKVNGKIWNYSFERKISLIGQTIRLDYTIHNHENFAIPGFWTFHPLFQAEENATIEWPGSHEIELAHPDKNLGKQGDKLPFPIGPKGEQLNRIRPFSSQTTRKFYHAGKYPTGAASLVLEGLKVEMKWDPEQIPYVGLWLNEGGYEQGYNVAIEPATGYYDTIGLALKNNSIQPIAAHQAVSFWLELKIIPTKNL